MKYGRRKWVRKARAENRLFALVAQLRSISEPEQNVSIEIMTMAFARFRQSDEWQAIGMFGRWIGMWRQLGKQHNQSGFGRSLNDIYKKIYSLSSSLSNTLYVNPETYAQIAKQYNDQPMDIAAWIPAGDVHMPVIADPAIPRDRAYLIPSRAKP